LKRELDSSRKQLLNTEHNEAYNKERIANLEREMTRLEMKMKSIKLQICNKDNTIIQLRQQLTHQNIEDTETTMKDKNILRSDKHNKAIRYINSYNEVPNRLRTFSEQKETYEREMISSYKSDYKKPQYESPIMKIGQEGKGEEKKDGVISKRISLKEHRTARNIENNIHALEKDKERVTISLNYIVGKKVC